MKTTAPAVFESPFGGSLLGKAHARSKRPFRKGRGLHITLSANPRRGLSFLEPKLRRQLMVILRRQARLHELKIQGARLGSLEIHLEARATKRERVSGFLRASSGLIGRAVSGREKGARPLKSKGTLWKCRPLTAILNLRSRWEASARLLERQLQNQGALGFSGSVAVPAAFFSSA